MLVKAKWLWLRVIIQEDPSSTHDAGSSFSILVLRNLCSEALETWQFVVLVNDSHIGGLNSITIKMEYLFAFQIWFFELGVEKQWGGGRKHYFVNFLFFKDALTPKCTLYDIWYIIFSEKYSQQFGEFLHKVPSLEEKKCLLWYFKTKLLSFLGCWGKEWLRLMVKGLWRLKKVLFYLSVCYICATAFEYF